jgi:tripartite-type tricarboxylate transporter receptor subunit TctC
MKRMILAIFLLLLIGNPAAQAQTPFYQGKTITFITGSQPGELFDLYARAVGQHMVKHIPGNPDVIVQNMPGAGHMIAANYVYNIAKPDGLTLAEPSRPSTSINSLGSRRSSTTGQSSVGSATLESPHK